MVEVIVLEGRTDVGVVVREAVVVVVVVNVGEDDDGVREEREAIADWVRVVWVALIIPAASVSLWG